MTIVKYQIAVQIQNYKVHNGHLSNNGILTFNPCQKDDKSTPVFAITEDGVRHQIDTLHFFQAFGVEKQYTITSHLNLSRVKDIKRGVVLEIAVNNIDICFENQGSDSGYKNLHFCSKIRYA